MIIDNDLMQASLFLAIQPYPGYPNRVKAWNIGIGKLEVRELDPDTYEFVGTYEDDYGTARILSGKTDEGDLTFRLIYDSAMDNQVPNEIQFALKWSFLGGWSGEFSFTSPSSEISPGTGLATCAIIA